MVCDGCSSRVLEALQKMPGVAVDLEKGVATVELAAASQLDAFNEIPKLIATVTDLGFEAQPHFE
jgi:copper chaperone CopZ